MLERLDLEVAAGRGRRRSSGPSGCGKSTLLELIAGLLEPSGGTIAVGGPPRPRERLARCAYMPQRDLLLPWLRGDRQRRARAAQPRRLARRGARARRAPLFERFGLAGFERARPAELSGGMRQRVAFLRTLLAGKPVLLLDEPFASLDAITRAEMQEWLARGARAEPRTTLLVTHDVEEALYLCDRVLVLSRAPGARRSAELRAAPRAAGAPRAEAVADPSFVAPARARAARRCAEGSR